MTGAGAGRHDWNDQTHRQPSAIEVATLYRTHGYRACCERWAWISPRKISSLARAGKRQLERRHLG